MVLVGRPRVPRLTGLRPLVLLIGIALLTALSFIVHSGFCVGGRWVCGVGVVGGGGAGVGAVAGAGSEVIVQLRRDVAATLLQLARDIRLGETASVVGQLETTASLLDPRCSRQVTALPTPRRGYIPSPLPSLSSLLHMGAPEEEEDGEGARQRYVEREDGRRMFDREEEEEGMEDGRRKGDTELNGVNGYGLVYRRTEERNKKEGEYEINQGERRTQIVNELPVSNRLNSDSPSISSYIANQGPPTTFASQESGGNQQSGTISNPHSEPVASQKSDAVPNRQSDMKQSQQTLEQHDSDYIQSFKSVYPIYPESHSPSFHLKRKSNMSPSHPNDALTGPLSDVFIEPLSDIQKGPSNQPVDDFPINYNVPTNLPSSHYFNQPTNRLSNSPSGFPANEYDKRGNHPASQGQYSDLRDGSLINRPTNWPLYSLPNNHKEDNRPGSYRNDLPSDYANPASNHNNPPNDNKNPASYHSPPTSHNNYNHKKNNQPGSYHNNPPSDNNDPLDKFPDNRKRDNQPRRYRINPPSDHDDPARHPRPPTSQNNVPKSRDTPAKWTSFQGSVKNLVTVLLDGCATTPDLTAAVARQACRQWPGIRVVVGVDEGRRDEVEDINHLPRLSIITVECERWRRGDLRPLLGGVSTPYVLVLSGVSAVTSDISLPRLLGILDTWRGVGVVGGAERGKDGAWDAPCTRLEMRNFRLSLWDGYDYSRDACLFCDVTSSSFLASTKVLFDVPFDLILPSRSQTVDWGLRLQRRGVLAMTCPDVMFHVNRNIKQQPLRVQDKNCLTSKERKAARTESWVVRRQFRKLAQKWELNRVVFDNGTSYEFTCREIKFDCNAYWRVRFYILPPCCIKAKNKMLNTFDMIAKESRVPYIISSGTLLGAIKFRDALPWDFDDDTNFLNKDVGAFMRNTQRMRRLGLSTRFSNQPNQGNKTNPGKYIQAYSHGGFSMDIWGQPNLTSLATANTFTRLPNNLAIFQYGHVLMPISLAKEALRNMPGKTSPIVPPRFYLLSQVRVASNWLPAPWNPGKAALVKYGEGLYRHEAHWRWFNQSHPEWKTCPRSGHHSCLDLHPLDGSIPFL